MFLHTIVGLKWYVINCFLKFFLRRCMYIHNGSEVSLNRKLTDTFSSGNINEFKSLHLGPVIYSWSRVGGGQMGSRVKRDLVASATGWVKLELKRKEHVQVSVLLYLIVIYGEFVCLLLNLITKRDLRLRK